MTTTWQGSNVRDTVSATLVLMALLLTARFHTVVRVVRPSRAFEQAQ